MNEEEAVVALLLNWRRNVTLPNLSNVPHYHNVIDINE